MAIALLLTAATVATAATAPVTAPIDLIRSGTAHEGLFDIAFTGPRAIAVGSSGAVVKSDDGGLTWRIETPVPTSLSLLGVAVNETRVIAVGQAGLILARGGDESRWTTVQSGTPNRLFSVGMNRRNEAVAVGAFGTVLRSTNGGASWKAISPEWMNYAQDGVDPHLYVARVSDDGVITIGGEFGLILRSSTGGANWTLAHKGSASLFALQVRDDGIGYAVGQSGTVLRTSDRGATWVAIDPVTSANLLGVHSTSGGHVIVTGMRDMLESTDDGRTWKHVITAETTTSWYSGVGQSNPSAPLLIVGHAGQIGRVTHQ